MKDRAERTWLAAAMTIPLAQTAGGTPLLTTLLASAILLPLSLCREEVPQPRWLQRMHWFACVLAAGTILGRTAACWPETGMEILVPGILLLLSTVSAQQGKREACRAANVLRFGVYGILAALLLSGMKEIYLPNLRCVWGVPGAELILVLLIPSIAGMGGKDIRLAVRLGAAALLFSFLGVGVLGKGGDLYELSRSLSILGVAERFESLTAAAITVGYFQMVSLLVCAGAQRLEGERKTAVRLTAAAAVPIFIAGKFMNIWWIAGFCAFILAINAAWTRMKNLKNRG